MPSPTNGQSAYYNVGATLAVARPNDTCRHGRLQESPLQDIIETEGNKGINMKTKYSLISSIIQLTVGSLAVISFIILSVSGENMTRWIVTLMLSVAFVVLGIIGILDYKSQDKGE